MKSLVNMEVQMMIMKPNKIPIPPLPPKSNLYKPISFWADIMLTLDKKIQYMEENMAFGEVGVTFKLWRGKVTDITWTDHVNDKLSVDKIGGKNTVIAENNKDLTK